MLTEQWAERGIVLDVAFADQLSWSGTGRLNSACSAWQAL